MKAAQILTKEEFLLVQNAAILQLKNSAIQKLKQCLENFQQELKSSELIIAMPLQVNIDAHRSKISRGENYLGLPYLVLDYPAHFSAQSIFAFRAFFWWGNFFSFTLHLQGEALEKLRHLLLKNCALIQQSQFLICIHNSPWNYHLESSNYKPASSFHLNELQELIRAKSFFKISSVLEIADYEQLNERGLATYLAYLSFFK